MDAFVSIFGIVMTTISTIAVAIIGCYQKKIDKRNEAYLKLRDEHDALLQKERTMKEEESEHRLQSIEQSVSQLTKEVSDLKESTNLDKISSQLTNLHSLNEVNFEYIRSLSGVVTTIAESLSSSNTLSKESKEEMDDKVDNHKSKEDEIVKKLYKIFV